MSVQPKLFPEQQEPETIQATTKAASLWFQRISLLILVIFCIYLGLLLTVIPWWTRVWDQNLFILSHPSLASVLRLGAVRGFFSGLGLLDIWIGISEAVHYREHHS